MKEAQNGGLKCPNQSIGAKEGKSLPRYEICTPVTDVHPLFYDPRSCDTARIDMLCASPFEE